MNRECAELLATPLGWNETCLETLARWEESEILERIGLTLRTYGTVRVVTGNAKARRVWVFVPPLVKGLNFGVEALPANLHHIATEQGAILSDIADQKQEEALALLRDACEVVGVIAPVLWQSLSFLLRSVHLISSPCSETDVSFSLPNLPNTIFVSLPKFDGEYAVARLVESIVHEVLHLQLSLVEKCFPIIRGDMATEYMYSPWRDILRPEGGIVHGLFVFCTLGKMWSRVKKDRSDHLSCFAEPRVDEIRDQIALVNSSEFRTLTSFGEKVIAGLFERNNQK